MSVDPVVARMWEMASSVAAGEGMEVVDIEFQPEGRGILSPNGDVKCRST